MSEDEKSRGKMVLINQTLPLPLLKQKIACLPPYPSVAALVG